MAAAIKVGAASTPSTACALESVRLPVERHPDWADYPRANSDLQEKPAHSMAPNERTLYMLDHQNGENAAD